MENKPRFRFALWRLFAAVLLFSLAAGLVRMAYAEVARYGGSFWPVFCLIAAILLFVGGVGCLFHRAVEFVIRAARLIAEWFM
jgi:hypothetical protein